MILMGEWCVSVSETTLRPKKTQMRARALMVRSKKTGFLKIRRKKSVVVCPLDRSLLIGDLFLENKTIQTTFIQYLPLLGGSLAQLVEQLIYSQWAH